LHSQIDEGVLNFFIPNKPEFPEEGSALECPHCGTKAVYQRHQLTYQA
jgi:hypothetical protein